MPQNPQNVTNPGLVNVADQGDGLLTVDQPVTVGPSQSAGSATVAVAPSGGGAGVFTVTSPNDVLVVTEVFGTGLPQNVFIP